MTFPTGVETRKYSDEELTAMLDEAREASKHAHKLGRVMGIVAAHRIKQMREFLMYEELAIWRRENGFNRAEESYFYVHHSLPPTPEQYYAGLWSEVNALKEAISMPAEDTVTRPRQEDSVDARIKECVERRSRKAARAQVTAVTRDDTVQHCSPISHTPVPPSGVYFNLKNEERMELDELESSLAVTGLETPGQQCPPNKGVWETGRITANGFLTAGVDSRKKGKYFVKHGTSDKGRTVTVAGISSISATPSNPRHTTFSEENKKFDPGGQGGKARLGTRLYSTFFTGESWQTPCCFLFVLRALCFLCVCFPKLFFPKGDHF